MAAGNCELEVAELELSELEVAVLEASVEAWWEEVIVSDVSEGGATSSLSIQAPAARRMTATK
jgi:hypothetical protein